VRGFGSIYVDGHCTNAYTSVVLHKEPAAVHSSFSETLPLERLEVVMKFMHFSDNSKQNDYQGPPKLLKIYPVIQQLSNKFQNLCIPNQNTAIDESLTLWKGRLFFRQNISLKGAKFGVKTYELCESSSGYVCSG
jgi:hypothetical protein